MESIKGFTLGGLRAADGAHAGRPRGRRLGARSGPVKGGKLVKVKDWFQGYRAVIQKHLAADASKS